MRTVYKFLSASGGLWSDMTWQGNSKGEAAVQKLQIGPLCCRWEDASQIGVQLRIRLQCLILLGQCSTYTTMYLLIWNRM